MPAVKDERLQPIYLAIYKRLEEENKDGELAGFSKELSGEILDVATTQITNVLAHLAKIAEIPEARELLKEILSDVLKSEKNK